MFGRISHWFWQAWLVSMLVLGAESRASIAAEAKMHLRQAKVNEQKRSLTRRGASCSHHQNRANGPPPPPPLPSPRGEGGRGGRGGTQQGPANRRGTHLERKTTPGRDNV